ncbi:LPS assembly lipoprotein LptE [Tianweitania sediminis]|jgi:LPS-assembly lipoprotein|uniref:LPS-assembly lipoprotein n=1 Tax=Tianweitania sediminis TaxID=1502156 RepID=A0A8J7UIC1_9HYPH|nr:LPS assembly lipoprotein LptE [Tianweitania sediminis]MBP0437640.1 hypothetical protein [Tianweitania sediminis]HEV7418020.1 LPS assembly lipoprotein LptE [Tianweitania sediminis]
MSSADGRKFRQDRFLRVALVCATSVLVLAAAGCQVRPLYGAGAVVFSASTGEATPLSSISIRPVNNRPAQIVRNQMIFLFNGGAQPQTQTRYTVALNVTSETASAAYVQVAEEDEPTAGTVTMRGAYELSDNQTGEVIRRGSRQVVASYDVSRQQFAALRAERDAQERAGRELAELLRLAIAQDLSQPVGFNRNSSVAPPVAEVTPRPGDQTDGPLAD